jgi:hypothetical protein
MRAMLARASSTSRKAFWMAFSYDWPVRPARWASATRTPERMRPAWKIGAVMEGETPGLGQAGVEQVAQVVALQAEGAGQGDGREIGGPRGADVGVGGDQLLFGRAQSGRRSSRSEGRPAGRSSGCHCSARLCPRGIWPGLLPSNRLKAFSVRATWRCRLAMADCVGPPGFRLGHVQFGDDAVAVVELDLGQLERVAARVQGFARDLQLAIERAQVEVGGHAGHQSSSARLRRPSSVARAGRGRTRLRGAPGPTRPARRRAGRTGCTGPPPRRGGRQVARPRGGETAVPVDRGEEGGALDAR